MEFKQYGQPKKNISQTMYPQKYLQEHVLKRLDFLLGFLLNINTELHSAFLEKLAEKINQAVKLAHFSDRELEITFMLTHFPNLQPYPGLIKQHMNLYIQLLGITESQFWNNPIFAMPISIWENTAFRFEVHQIMALVAILGKPDALVIYQAYLDQYSIENADRLPTHKTLEDLRRAFILEAESSLVGHVRTISTIKNGRFVHRCDNCAKMENLDWQDIQDPEILETLLCYKDYQETILYNVNFTLTRQRSFVRGHSYCDEVIHDARVAEKIVHPDETFWKTIDQKLFIEQMEM